MHCNTLSHALFTLGPGARLPPRKTLEQRQGANGGTKGAGEDVTHQQTREALSDAQDQIRLGRGHRRGVSAPVRVVSPEHRRVRAWPRAKGRGP